MHGSAWQRVVVVFKEFQKKQEPVNQEQGCKLLPLNAIRTETVLSRFPIHNLAKTGNLDIQIRQTKENDEIDLRWEVSYSSRFGEPRQLAYKLDTLIINRRIEEAGRPVPRIIRLGSLREICRELGIPEGGDAISRLKKAFHQNAATYVNTKLRYKGVDGIERTLEAGFSRYSVVFTGETLPDGRKADAVHLVLNDIYREVLDTAPFRPLDYDYLKSLSPGAQRCYEIVSYRIFPAVKHKNPTAKIPYSEYCMYSGQERYFEREKARKQMWKLHQPHLKSSYFAEARFENIPNNQGEPDWMLMYVPGKKALDEYKAFTKKQKELLNIAALEYVATEAAEAKLQGPAPQPKQPALTNEEKHFIKELMERFTIHEDTATKLVTTKLERVKFQLEVYPFRQHARIKDKAAYIIKAIERNYTAPSNYEETQAKKEREASVAKAKALEQARSQHEEKFRCTYYEYLRTTEAALKINTSNKYVAFEEHNAEAVMKAMRIVTNPSGPAGRAILSEEARLTRFRDFFLPRDMVLSFWQWDETHNPERFVGHLH